MAIAHLAPPDRQAILEMAWLIARADGHVRAREQRRLKELEAEAALPEAELQDIRQRAAAGGIEPRVPESPEARQVLLDILRHMVVVDGQTSAAEFEALNRIAKIMGLPSGDRNFVAPSPTALGELKGDLARELDNLRALFQGRPRRLEFPLLALLVGELTIFLGVLFLGWSVYETVLLVWFETVVIGAFNALKMMTAREPAKGILQNIQAWMEKLFLIPFFLVHFGAFCFAHGTFLTMLFGGGLGGRDIFSMLPRGISRSMSWGLAVSAACLVVAHGLSFIRDFIGRGEYRRVTPSDLMARPYGRIVVTHVAILVLAVPCLYLPRLAAALIVPLKMAFDMAGYRRERRLAEAAAEDVSPPSGSWLARHRGGLFRLFTTAAVLAALAVAAGELIRSATAPFRARKARIRALFLRTSAGMSPGEALAASVPWTTAFTHDSEPAQVELRQKPDGGLLVRMSNQGDLTLETGEARAWMDEALPELLKNRLLYLFVMDGEEHIHATYSFGPNGRLTSAWPTGGFR